MGVGNLRWNRDRKMVVAGGLEGSGVTKGIGGGAGQFLGGVMLGFK